MRLMVKSYFFWEENNFDLDQDMVIDEESVMAEFTIGAEDDEGEEIFHGVIMPLDKFVSSDDQATWIEGRGYFFVRELTTKAVREVVQAVSDIVRNIEGKNWDEISDQISRYLFSEHDNNVLGEK